MQPCLTTSAFILIIPEFKHSVWILSIPKPLIFCHPNPPFWSWFPFQPPQPSSSPLLLLLAEMASAAISIISRLCSVGCQNKTDPNSPKLPSAQETERKFSINPPPSPSSHPPPAPPWPPTAETTTTMIPPFPLEASDYSPTENDQNPQIKELPLPPARQVTLQQQAFSCRESCNDSSKNLLSKSSSTRNFITNTFSIKMPRSMSVSRNRDGAEEAKKRADKKKKEKLKHQDSVWTKTIILGEKCRVPDDDNEEDVVYDFKGNKISPYHPKAPSRVVSRQNSEIDHNSILANDG